MEKKTNYAGNEPNYIDDVNNNLDMIMEDYSMYLRDGDYERFMPMLHESLPPEFELEIYRELARLYWILNRFTEYGSYQWRVYNTLFSNSKNMIRNAKAFGNNTLGQE